MMYDMVSYDDFTKVLGMEEKAQNGMTGVAEAWLR